MEIVRVVKPDIPRLKQSAIHMVAVKIALGASATKWRGEYREETSCYVLAPYGEDYFPYVWDAKRFQILGRTIMYNYSNWCSECKKYSARIELNETDFPKICTKCAEKRWGSLPEGLLDMVGQSYPAYQGWCGE